MRTVRVVGIIVPVIDDIDPVAFNEHGMMAWAIHRVVVGGLENRVLRRVILEWAGG